MELADPKFKIGNHIICSDGTLGNFVVIINSIHFSQWGWIYNGNIQENNVVRKIS